MAKDVIRVSESGSGERLRLADGPRALWHRGGHRRQLATCCRRSAVAEPYARLLSESLRLSRAHCSTRSEEHTSELQSRLHLVCRLLLEKKNTNTFTVLSRH